MIKEFKKYDRIAIKSTEVPISVLNQIFEAAESDLRILTRHEESSQFCKMSSHSEQNKPHTAIAGDILGIHICDWQWSNDGYSVVIKYA